MAVDEEALLEEIARDPDDERAYLVYADWLQARGDPRGELISIQQALRGGNQDPERAHQQRILQDDFLRGREPHFLEGLLERTENQVVPAGWRFGFIERVLFQLRPGGPSLEACLEVFFALKSARFVRDLLVMGDGADALFPWLAGTGAWKHARSLEVRSNQPFEHLPALADATPRLAALTIQSAGFSFAGLVLPALTTLHVRGDHANEKTLGGLATARWPVLTSLTMSFRRWERGSTPLVAPMFAAESTPALRHLSLPGWVTALDDPMLAVAQSGLLDRLETLQVDNPKLFSHTTRLLLPHRARLASLKFHLQVP